jgi:hypothetical protein
MRWTIVILIGASLTFVGCGSDDGGGVTQTELADLFIAIGPAEIPGGIDEGCIRDKTAELSDDDAQWVIDNLDNSDAQPGSELQAWADGLVTCFIDVVDDGEAPETDGVADDSSDAGGSVQVSLAARLIEQSGVAGLGIDEECARENADELSGDDAQFLLDNYFVTIDLETASAEQQAWVDSIVDCLL